MIPLKQVHIPTPCHESWEAMTGDAQQRLCAGCRKHVHNLSEMSRDEAQAVIDRADGRVCVRFFPGADGRPLTRDDLAPPTAAALPAFATRGRRRLAAAASWAVAVLMSGLGFAQGAARPAHGPTNPPHRYKLGQFTLPKPHAARPRPGHSARPGFDSGPAPAVMGGPRVAPRPPLPARMGDIAPPPAAMGEMAPAPTPRK